jgi:hypothetical protein
MWDFAGLVFEHLLASSSQRVVFIFALLGVCGVGGVRRLRKKSKSIKKEQIKGNKRLEKILECIRKWIVKNSIIIYIILILFISICVIFIIRMRPISPSDPQKIVPTESPAFVPADSPAPTPAAAPTVAIGQKLPLGSYRDEPIQWRVLAVQSDRALLLSEYVLDVQPYNKNYAGVTWETCSLRAWLNKSFYNTVFTDAEKPRIRGTAVENTNNPAAGTNDDADKADWLFLLSVEEAESYFLNDTDRIAKPTTHAKKQGATIDANGAGWWWLRSSDVNSRNAAIVNIAGGITDKGTPVNSSAVGVRPALWLNLP